MEHCCIALDASRRCCAFAHLLYVACQLGRLVLRLASLIEKEIRCSAETRQLRRGPLQPSFTFRCILKPSSAHFELVLCTSKSRLPSAPVLFTTFQRGLVQFYLR